MWKCPECGREFTRTGQSHYCGSKPANIDEYIARQDESLRARLYDVRNAIRSAIPDAKETITWSMPNWKGRHNVIQFALNKNHIGLYPGEEAVTHFSEKLTGYETSKGNIRLPLDRPLPVELISEIAAWCWQQDMEG